MLDRVSLDHLAMLLFGAGILAAIADAKTDSLDGWLPNIATSAWSIAITIFVVDKIIERRDRLRMKPRVDRAMGQVGRSYQWLVRLIALDYQQTHRGTFETLPPMSLDVLSHWLANAEREDRRRADGEPWILAAALSTATGLRKTRDDERDVLEPAIVAAIDEFEEDARMAYTVWFGMEDAPSAERARQAIAEIVSSTRAFGEVLIRFDSHWNHEAGDMLYRKPGSWGTETDPMQTPEALVGE